MMMKRPISILGRRRAAPNQNPNQKAHQHQQQWVLLREEM